MIRVIFPVGVGVGVGVGVRVRVGVGVGQIQCWYQIEENIGKARGDRNYKITEIGV